MVKNPLNTFLSTDPDHLIGGLSHVYAPSCVTKIKSIGAIIVELRAQMDKQTHRQTDPNALLSHSSPGAMVINQHKMNIKYLSVDLSTFRNHSQLTVQ